METKKLPVGLRYIRVVTILSFAVFALMLYSTFTILKEDYFGLVGIIGTIYTIFSLAVSVFLLYTIARPTESRYKVLVALLIVDAVLSLQGLYGLNTISLFTVVWGVFLTLLCLWYFTKIKAYFVKGQIEAEDSLVKNSDKKFKILFWLLMASLFVIPISIGVVGGINKAADTVSQNESLPATQTIFEVKNATLTANKYFWRKFDFAERQDLLVDLTTDDNSAVSAVVILTESEFEKSEKDSNYTPSVVSTIRSNSVLVPLDAGKYVFMIIGGDRGFKYSLSLKVK